MTTIDYPEPNTTVARLHLSLNGTYKNKSKTLRKTQVIKEFEEWTEGDLSKPSGATIIKGTGLWFPMDKPDEIEDNLIIEVWVDDKQELEHVRDLKDRFEKLFDQHCVCLSLEDRYYEH